VNEIQSTQHSKFSDASVLEFQAGNENAPDAIFGLETLRLHSDGRLWYCRRRNTKKIEITATYNQTKLNELLLWLRQTSFPQPLQTKFAPGSGPCGLRIEPFDDELWIEESVAKQHSGYREIFAALNGLLKALRTNDSTRLADWGFVDGHV
jgi:hypothetical protein